MARIIIAIVLLVTIITLGVVDQVFINNSFNEVITKTKDIQRLLENKDYDNAYNYAKETLNWWRKKREILELTCPHNEVKEFINTLASLCGSIHAENYEDALTISQTLQEDALTRLNILSYKIKNVL